MTDSLNEINRLNETVARLDFKPPGIFANSLLQTQDTTQLIRDIRDEEVVFFKGKKRFEIDYELINNDKNNDVFVEREFKNLLVNDDTEDLKLNEKLDSLLPKDLNLADEYYNEINELREIFKRTYKITKLWAKGDSKMLDNETNGILDALQEKLNNVFGLLIEISKAQQELKAQKERLSDVNKET